MSKVKRKVLTLNEGVDVLKQLESGRGSRNLFLEFESEEPKFKALSYVKRTITTTIFQGR